MSKKMFSVRLPEDTQEVLRNVATYYGISQADICDRAISHELIRIMSLDKGSDVKREYEQWKQRGE